MRCNWIKNEMLWLWVQSKMALYGENTSREEQKLCVFAMTPKDQRVKSHKKCQNNWHCMHDDDPFHFTHLHFIQKQWQKKALFMHKNRINNDNWKWGWNCAVVAALLVFVCTLFHVSKVKCMPRLQKDNKENIGLGWKARALSTAPLEKIFCCCRSRTFSLCLFDVWCFSTRERLSMSLHSIFFVLRKNETKQFLDCVLKSAICINANRQEEKKKCFRKKR